MIKQEEIRAAEKESHTDIYTKTRLFERGTWLEKPVKTVMELLPYFDGYESVTVLDLGCGVGRNSIPIAQHFKGKHCSVDCIDILDIAVEKLLENSKKYGVRNGINGSVAAIEDFFIKENAYDFIVAVSALEHVESEDAFISKLFEIRNGIRKGGIVCLIVNAEVREQAVLTGMELEPQFEVNMPTDKMQNILKSTFESWDIIKTTVVLQEYSIVRSGNEIRLKTNVITFAARK